MGKFHSRVSTSMSASTALLPAGGSFLLSPLNFDLEDSERKASTVTLGDLPSLGEARLLDSLLTVDPGRAVSSPPSSELIELERAMEGLGGGYASLLGAASVLSVRRAEGRE